MPACYHHQSSSVPSAPAENPGSEAKPAAGVVVVADWVAERSAVVAAMGFALELAAAAAAAVAGIGWGELAPVTAQAFPKASPPNQR